ncbi:hypothetical protein BKA64DRAFT_671055 [Cadophora sp. MPI-SDFR-AT-0126]|nr:hypothetical protein BKA64DRAFT_671055 [Leotiomycetes sp. MPI-SDFR-AT-0126]
MNTGLPRGAIVVEGKNRHTAMSGRDNNFWRGMLTILGDVILASITPRFWSMGMAGTQFDCSLIWCDYIAQIPDYFAKLVRQFFLDFAQWYSAWPEANDRIGKNLPIDNALMYVTRFERDNIHPTVLENLASDRQFDERYRRLYPTGEGRILDGLAGLPGFPAVLPNNYNKSSRGYGRRSDNNYGGGPSNRGNRAPGRGY